MWKRQVGERICQLRKERHLTRAEFGELIGKSESYVGKLERGTISMTGDVVLKICDITETSTDYILRGTADPMATVASLSGLSLAQLHVFLDIAAETLTFFRTLDGGNNAILQEAYRRSKQRTTHTS